MAYVPNEPDEGADHLHAPPGLRAPAHLREAARYPLDRRDGGGEPSGDRVAAQQAGP